jgi:hypothetical protein
MSFPLGLVLTLALTRASAAPDSTVISGLIVASASQAPLVGATVHVGSADSTITDSLGRFVLRVPRSAASLHVGMAGYRAFQFPLLQLSADSLAATIELRRDPPTTSYIRGHLPLLCVIFEPAVRLSVTNACDASAFSGDRFERRIIKHNPWSLYFGPAGDDSGVLLFTARSAPPRASERRS